LGRGALKLMDFDTPVNVVGYDAALGSKEYRIISGAVGYVHPHSGTKYHVIVHQAVHMPDLDHHLLCPMQCRVNGVTVNECPRMYCQNPTKESHAIVIKDENGSEGVMPLFLKGVTYLLLMCGTHIPRGV